MRLARVWIRSYRCLSDVEVVFDDYTPLIGPNGSGKSSVLYALEWFFNGGEISEEDISLAAGDDSRVEVEVEFRELDSDDRSVLGMYARSDSARFRRSWSTEDGEKIIGNAAQGPGFASIRNEKSMKPMKLAYEGVASQVAGLPKWKNMTKARADLEEWEASDENRGSLVSVDDADASHLFGFTGESVLAKRFRMILVPAAADLAAEIGEAGKGSILSRVLGAVTVEAVANARAAWEKENEEEIEELRSSIKSKVDSVTKLHEVRINEHFGEFVTNAQVIFRSEPPAWTMGKDATVIADVMIGGQQVSVDRQGHGVQRAVMISALQSLIPDTPVSAHDAEPADISGSNSGPAFLLALEEPEIYQHPIRARHFARVLNQMSGGSRAQVVLATHSPYFVRPEQFSSLRTFSNAGGMASVKSASVQQVSDELGVNPRDVLKFMEKNVPTVFSEGFFADLVVLVEGDTDRIVIETIAEKLKKPLDAQGIAVISVGGKQNLRQSRFVLESLGVSAYVVADGDAPGAKRKHPNDDAKALEGWKSRRDATDKLLLWLPASNACFGEIATCFEHPTSVTSRWTLLHDDIEAELEDWDGFSEEMSTQGETLRGKNVLAYRNAAFQCDLGKLPESLSALISAIVRWRETSSRGT